MYSVLSSLFIDTETEKVTDQAGQRELLRKRTLTTSRATETDAIPVIVPEKGHCCSCLVPLARRPVGAVGPCDFFIVRANSGQSPFSVEEQEGDGPRERA